MSPQSSFFHRLGRLAPSPARSALFAGVLSLLAAAALGACGGGADGATAVDDDAGQSDGGGDDATTGDDGGGGDAGGDETNPGGDTTPPAKITLAATPHGLTSIQLDWTAVGDDDVTGTASGYDVRVSSTPITSLTEFNNASLASGAPTPAQAGIGQSMVVGNLTQGTTYYFAIRARDDANNWSPLSNSPSATTLARAALQIAEVAPANSGSGGGEGRDFVELVALTAGRVDGLEIRESGGTLYTFGNLEVAAGDRLVVHADGLPCATGCSSEDTTNNIAGSTEPFATATAWDVYSLSTGISASDNLISLLDGATVVDAVAMSNRDGDASVTNMTAFAAAQGNGSWIFGATPSDGVNDCATQKDAASIATTATSCGGQPAIDKGLSLQRAGTTDTNTRADFYAAPQTRGAANGANAAPTVVSAVATAADTVHVTFSEDIAAGSVTLGAFTATGGLNVTAATASDVNEVTLTTSSQTTGFGYTVSVANTVTDLQGTALGSPNSATLCGFNAAGVAMLINEVAPTISAGADLVELRVTSGGAIGGITLRKNPTSASLGNLLATMPGICAATGDLIVVHLKDDASAPATEMAAKDEYPNATYAANYDGAWDVKGSNSADIAGTTAAVLAVFADPPSGGAAVPLLDAVPFTSGVTNASLPSGIDELLARSQWSPACGTSPCDDSTSPTAVEVSASYAGTGSDPTGSTVARDAAGTDTNTAGDWTVGASTLGGSN